MAMVDSLDKVIKTYAVSVCVEPFIYKDQEFTPRLLHVSPGIFRGYTCPSLCGACCLRFSLDYIPGEARPPGVQKRYIQINRKDILIYSDLQKDHSSHHCRNLDMETGRCGIYSHRPFTCDFELVRFAIFAEKAQVTVRKYGRAWAMLRIDGGRGTKCDILPPSPQLSPTLCIN